MPVLDANRIDQLRRRVENDPASIAFAQLGEELRRAGAAREAVEICRAGLAVHPTYLSARVTLGRALVELNDLETAQTEMKHVLASAADNLAALRALGEIFRLRGELDASLEHFRTALELAPNDPDLEDAVCTLQRQIEARQAMQVPGPSPIQSDPHGAAAFDAALAVSFVSEPADPEHARAIQTVATLESWLDAIHVARSVSRA
jgi:tetratricopeptide (TPR) repeat protein